MIEYNKLDNWESGWISTNGNIGTVVDITPVFHADWQHQMIQVSKGDKIYAHTIGGTSPRAIAILDDEYKIVSHSNAGEEIDNIFEIEHDGFVIVNNHKPHIAEPKVLHYPFSQDNTDLGRVYTTHNHGEDTTEEYQVTIGENVYPAVKIGNKLWTAKNLDENLGTIGVDEWYYNGRSEKTRLNSAYTFTASTSTFRDDNVTLFDGALDYIRNIRNEYFHTYFKVTLRDPAPIDIPLIVYVNESDGSYSRIGNTTIPQGSTEGIIDSYAKIQTTTTKNYGRTFIRIGVTSGKIEPTITYTWICRLNFGTSDCGENAITYTQALANEETAKSNNYGRLYTWDNINDNISKLNLKGWRWPTKSDFDALRNIDTTGTKLRAKTFANGTDDFGIAFLGEGTRNLSGSFVNKGVTSYLWGEEKANIYIQTNSVGTRYVEATENGFAVRLVLDIPEDGSLPDGTVKITHNKGSRNVGKGYIQDNNYQPGDFNVNEQMTLMGKYGVTKIGNQLWTTENLDEELGTIGADEWYYGGRSTKTRATDSKIRNNITIRTSSEQNSLGNWYDWNTGATSGSSIFIRPNQTMYVAMKLTFSTPLVDNQPFRFRYWGYRLEQGGSLEQRDFTLGEVEAGSSTATIIGTETNGLVRIGRNFNPTLVVTGNASNNGITFSISEIRICYSSTDCGVDAITVPQALANEETAKSNKYGKLYTWNNVNDNLSKLNLNGWRWPNKEDYNELMTIDPTGNIFSDVSAGGTNETGMSLINTGRYDEAAANVFAGNNQMFYWTNTTATTDYNAYGLRRTNTLTIEAFGKVTGRCLRLVLDLNPDGSYPEDATPLKLRETYKPYNRNIGTGAKPYIPNDDGKVYVDDVRCDIVCPHDKPETSETLSLASETIIEE